MQQSRSGQGMELTLNIAPIEFEDSSVEVGISPYQGRGQLTALREEHQQTHCFRREGKELLCVAVVPGVEVFGERVTTIQLKEHPHLCATLARNALVNMCAALERRTPSYAPVRVLGSQNLLASAAEEGCPGWLRAHSKYTFSTRVLRFGSRKPFAALVADVGIGLNIDKPCDELIAEGFDLQGLWVGRFEEQQDSRLAPRFRTIGRVWAIEGNELLLVDTRDDVERVSTQLAFIDSDVGAFERALDHVFGDRSRAVSERLARGLAQERTGPRRLEKLRKVIEPMSRRGMELLPGVPFSFAPFLNQKETAGFPEVKEAPRPVYVFDPAGSRTDTWNDRGLSAHGPYTRQFFTPNRPRVCVVCQKQLKGQVSQFLHKLREGVTCQKSYFDRGFLRKYCVEDIGFEFFCAEDASAEAYSQAVDDAIREGAQTGKWDLALIQIDEVFHQLRDERNPYLVAKAAFLTQHVPSQCFEIESARLPERQLSAGLNNMCLAIYAKLNGIPWLIKAAPGIEHEFVVGLGSTYIQQSKVGERERVVGITTVFKGDGNYFLSNVSDAVPIDRYEETLLNSLRRTIKKVSQDMNWQPRETIRLVFHAFKRMRNTEIDAVKSLISELGEYDVEYAFLHVKEHHSFMLFDEKQPGIRDFETGSQKGAMAPQRGLFFPLSDSETLLVLTGPGQLKRPEDGLPRPVLLDLHPASTFQDMTYLTRQVYAFSCHSWRSFFPSHMPVTILYSDLVARLLGQLSRLPKWNPDVMLGRIGTTRWFL